jgi:hypothetical protein
MLRFLSITLILLLLTIVWVPSPATLSAADQEKRTAAPQSHALAVLPEAVFEFPPVIAGTVVTHDFIILNQGKEILKIDGIKTDCNCATVSFPDDVPSGGQGNIKAVFNSLGYDNEYIQRRLLIQTNDPIQPVLQVMLKGMVEGVAVIRPVSVRLFGKKEDDLKVAVEIIINPKTPFKIIETKAENGTNIQYDLKDKMDKDARSYLLTVRNIKKETIQYIDIIHLKTDSPIKPEIKVRVYGMIN